MGRSPPDKYVKQEISDSDSVPSDMDGSDAGECSVRENVTNPAVSDSNKEALVMQVMTAYGSTMERMLAQILKS